MTTENKYTVGARALRVCLDGTIRRGTVTSIRRAHYSSPRLELTLKLDKAWGGCTELTNQPAWAIIPSPCFRRTKRGDLTKAYSWAEATT